MRSIQSKITLTYLFLTLLAVVVFAIVASLATQRYLRREKVDELSDRIDVIAPLLKPESGDSLAAVAQHVKRLGLAMDLRITLLDSAGTVLVDSDVPFEKTKDIENHLQRPEIQQALQTGFGTNTRKSATVGQDFVYAAKLARIPDAAGELQRVRFIRLSAHLGEINAMASDERTYLMIAGLAVLALVIVVSLWVSRRISNPMVEIASAVEKIRSGNLDTRIAIRSDDEVGRVGQAVNEMVDKLKADIVQLTKLERVRSEFLGNVSHELRTPIFSLQGFLETLLGGAIDDPAVNKDFLQKAYNHSVRLNTLLGDLITISHIESGEMKMSFRYFNLTDLLSTLVDEFVPLAEHNEVTLMLAQETPRNIEALGDKERLRVVIENLIENAIKYNKTGGQVIVSCELQSGKALVEITDTGVGIPADHLPRIFERFYRVDKNRSREVGGTGLGLAIVKHIIEAHGSIVSVQSTPGKGSTFSFSLRT